MRHCNSTVWSPYIVSLHARPRAIPSNTIDNRYALETAQPTGMAFTPVPWDFGRFLDPRFFFAGSSSVPSGTDHVRLVDGACSKPDVAEYRCDLTRLRRPPSLSAPLVFSSRFF